MTNIAINIEKKQNAAILDEAKILRDWGAIKKTKSKKKN